MTLRLLSRIGKRYGVREGLSADSCGIGSRLGEINFRVARQLPKFVTWADPSNDFVNSGRQRSSSQELLELLGDGRRYDYHRMLSRFLPNTESACYPAQGTRL